MRWLKRIINPTDMSLSKLQEIVKDREAWLLWGSMQLASMLHSMGLQRVGHDLATVFLVVVYGCESWIIKKAEH